MKPLSALIGLALVALVTAGAAKNEAEPEILAVEKKLISALNRSREAGEGDQKVPVLGPDLGYLEGLADPSFVFISPQGKALSRSEWLRHVRVGNFLAHSDWATHKSETYSLEEKADMVVLTRLNSMYHSSNREVRRSGDTAVVVSEDSHARGGGVFYFPKKGAPPSSKPMFGGKSNLSAGMPYRSTRVYVRRNGDWKLLSFHATPRVQEVRGVMRPRRM